MTAPERVPGTRPPAARGDRGGEADGAGEADRSGTAAASHLQRYGPRERMVFSAAQLIRREGVSAAGMREIAAHAQAPRGSLQHYFPGGKEQLVNEAVAWAGRYASRRVDRFLTAMDEPTPSALFAAMIGQWAEEYRADGFGAGCPVASATVDCARSTASTREAVAAAFASWRAPVTRALGSMGVPEARSASLATLMISALEGAILIARAEQDILALTAVAAELGPMLDACVTRPRQAGAADDA
jgi:AcrR family transcriptional regulator